MLRFLHTRIAQRITLLMQMDAPHRSQAWRAAAAAWRQVVRVSQRQQRLPWNHLLHLVEEEPPTGLLTVAQALASPNVSRREDPSTSARHCP
jgi:hypothetical protein